MEHFRPSIKIFITATKRVPIFLHPDCVHSRPKNAAGSSSHVKIGERHADEYF